MRYDTRKIKECRSIDAGKTAGDLGGSTDDTFDCWQLDVMATAY